MSGTGAVRRDDHPADTVAFTVVQPDLRTHDLTYGTLRKQSERVAAGLCDLGVGPGDHVGVLMGKSADLVVALLAIGDAGPSTCRCSLHSPHLRSP